MATKEQSLRLANAADELLAALGKRPLDYRIDFGQKGLLILGPGDVPPFGFNRYTPSEFLTALKFATIVVEAMKK